MSLNSNPPFILPSQDSQDPLGSHSVASAVHLRIDDLSFIQVSMVSTLAAVASSQATIIAMLQSLTASRYPYVSTPESRPTVFLQSEEYETALEPPPRKIFRQAICGASDLPNTRSSAQLYHRVAARPLPQCTPPNVCVFCSLLPMLVCSVYSFVHHVTMPYFVVAPRPSPEPPPSLQSSPSLLMPIFNVCAQYCVRGVIGSQGFVDNMNFYSLLLWSHFSAFSIYCCYTHSQHIQSCSVLLLSRIIYSYGICVCIC